MSYLRGAHYIWASFEQTHFWAAMGDDGWADSGWAEGIRQDQPDSHAAPSGVGLPQEIADEYVVMRFAELIAENVLCEAIDRALAHGGGNGGCHELQQRAAAIRQAFPPGSAPQGAAMDRGAWRLRRGVRPRRIEVAPRSRLDAVEHLAERFFREVVVDHEYTECLVTDESHLSDFATLGDDRDAEISRMLDRLGAHYRLDARALGTTNIVRLLELLRDRGVTE